VTILRLALATAAFAAVPLFSACSASSSATGGSGGSTAAAGSSGGGAGGVSGGTGGSGGSTQINLDGGSSGGSGGLTEAGTCAGDIQKGELIPLDMYVMLDTSGSMVDKTTAGPTKWDAVKQAFTAFLKDPQSDGLGVGIQYFPLTQAGVPTSCTSNAQCGIGAPCLLKSCTGVGQIAPCSKNPDCPALSQCAPLGQCSGDPAYFCQPVGGSCSGGLGSCVQLTSSFCVNSTSCLVGDYSKPAVPIAVLPGASAALISSINAQTPNGNTPTGPALQGAIDQAKSWAKSHPAHTVITVLATDGLPTDCNPIAINQVAALAAQGASGTPSIDTFVIGVFGPNDTASQTNLDTIAKSGGTKQALIVDTSKNVTQQFINALNSIRGQALSCDFEIPPPPDGGTLDYNKINIDYTDSSGTTHHLYQVPNKSQCDPQKGGWYYDDPKAPTKIIVCDSTCNTFKQDGGQVETRVGCQTIIKPPQ